MGWFSKQEEDPQRGLQGEPDLPQVPGDVLVQLRGYSLFIKLDRPVFGEGISRAFCVCSTNLSSVG